MRERALERAREHAPAPPARPRPARRAAADGPRALRTRTPPRGAGGLRRVRGRDRRRARRRRAQFLRELTEAKELRARVQPRRARAARMRQQMRMRTFRW
ncbi:hypothetical protein [Streptomyces sp. S399]|uniref:hypothetical protein n=1 Tax=Streptomyces sp. S399 TaxID=3096009 RepID=UPI0039C2B4E9